MTMTEELVDRVRKCIGNVLAMNPEEIQAESRLIDDLGADSLDLVELMYLLENEFGVRIDRKDMSLSAQLGLSEDEVHEEELLTPKALALLRERYPAARDILVDGSTRKDLASLLTVLQVVRTVESKLAMSSEGVAHA